jgi:hypothetical protein
VAQLDLEPHNVLEQAQEEQAQTSQTQLEQAQLENPFADL